MCVFWRFQAAVWAVQIIGSFSFIGGMGMRELGVGMGLGENSAMRLGAGQRHALGNETRRALGRDIAFSNHFRSSSCWLAVYMQIRTAKSIWPAAIEMLRCALLPYQ